MANTQTGGAALPSNNTGPLFGVSPALAQPAMQGQLGQLAYYYGGMGTLPAVQRSQYLADALQSLRQTGGQNLRSPVALGSNLLAEALEQYFLSKNNAKLYGAVQAGQQ